MNKFHAAMVMTAAMVAWSGSAHAASFTYSGILSDAIVYHRPSYTNDYTPAFNCTDCGFQSEAISVATSGNYQFSSGPTQNFVDQVGILYSTQFDPDFPMVNYDGPLSYPIYLTGNTAILTLTAGVQYFWVTSTDYGYSNGLYDDCANGCTFTTTVTGPGAIDGSVPEPSTWAMLLVGLGVTGFMARRHKAVRIRYG